jgi:hypothetical protein
MMDCFCEFCKHDDGLGRWKRAVMGGVVLRRGAIGITGMEGTSVVIHARCRVYHCRASFNSGLDELMSVHAR